jgi:transcription antitermination factor NusG
MAVACPDVGRVKLDEAIHPWFALQVRSRFEAKTSTTLTSMGYECFLPQYRVVRRWSDRLKELELPLFPGYLFCRFDVHRRLPILMTAGVVGVVGIARQPVPVDETEIERIQTAISFGQNVQPWPYLQIGQRVTVHWGPLTGIEGVLMQARGKWRVVISVSLLQRSVALEVDRSWLRAVGVPRYPGFAQSQIVAATP